MDWDDNSLEYTSDQPLRKYLVTRVETVWVTARTPEQARFNGEQKLEFIGADTTDIEVEEEAIDIDGMAAFLDELED